MEAPAVSDRPLCQFDVKSCSGRRVSKIDILVRKPFENRSGQQNDCNPKRRALFGFVPLRRAWRRNDRMGAWFQRNSDGKIASVAASASTLHHASRQTFYPTATHSLVDP